MKGYRGYSHASYGGRREGRASEAASLYTGGVSDGQVGNGVCGNRTNAPPQRQKQLPLYEEDTVYLKVHHQIRRTRSSNMEN
jgi:hypothetical protein